MKTKKSSVKLKSEACFQKHANTGFGGGKSVTMAGAL